MILTEGVAAAPGERAVRALVARAWWTVPVAAALLAAALAEISIGRRSLEPGEAGRVLLARRPLGTIWEAARESDAVQLTTTLVWKAWLAVAGSSEEAVRYPSVVFAAAAVALTVLLGRELFGWPAGGVAGVVLATGGFLLAAAQTVGSTSLAVALVTAAGYAFLRAARCGHGAWWAAYVLLTVAAASASLATAPVVVAQVVYLALARPPRRERAGLALAAAVIGVVGYAALLGRWDAWHLEGLAGRRDGSLGEALWRLAGENPALAAAVAGGAVAVCLGRTAVAALGDGALLGVWLAAPVASALAVSLWRPGIEEDSLVAAVPPVALLTGAAVAALTRHRWAAGAAVAALAAGAGLALPDALQSGGSADWRAAARYVVAARGTGEDLLAAPGSQAAALAFYAPGAEIAAEPTSEHVWVVASGRSAGALLVAGRDAVGAPAYALLAQRQFGPGLMVQHWLRHGEPGSR